MKDNPYPEESPYGQEVAEIFDVLDKALKVMYVDVTVRDLIKEQGIDGPAIRRQEAHGAAQLVGSAMGRLAREVLNDAYSRSSHPYLTKDRNSRVRAESITAAFLAARLLGDADTATSWWNLLGAEFRNRTLTSDDQEAVWRRLDQMLTNERAVGIQTDLEDKLALLEANLDRDARFSVGLPPQVQEPSPYVPYVQNRFEEPLLGGHTLRAEYEEASNPPQQPQQNPLLTVGGATYSDELPPPYADESQISGGFSFTEDDGAAVEESSVEDNLGDRVRKFFFHPKEEGEVQQPARTRGSTNSDQRLKGGNASQNKRPESNPRGRQLF